MNNTISVDAKTVRSILSGLDKLIEDIKEIKEGLEESIGQHDVGLGKK